MRTARLYTVQGAGVVTWYVPWGGVVVTWSWCNTSQTFARFGTRAVMNERWGLNSDYFILQRKKYWASSHVSIQISDLAS